MGTSSCAHAEIESPAIAISRAQSREMAGDGALGYGPEQTVCTARNTAPEKCGGCGGGGWIPRRAAPDMQCKMGKRICTRHCDSTKAESRLSAEPFSANTTTATTGTLINRKISPKRARTQTHRNFVGEPESTHAQTCTTKGDLWCRHKCREVNVTAVEGCRGRCTREG